MGTKAISEIRTKRQPIVNKHGIPEGYIQGRVSSKAQRFCCKTGGHLSKYGPQTPEGLGNLRLKRFYVTSDQRTVSEFYFWLELSGFVVFLY